MTKNKLLLLFTAALLTPVNFVFAAETTWGGFLSASVGKTLDTDKTYLVDPVTNASYTDEWQSEPESMVGLQATSVISDKMRTTVQMLAKGYDQWDVNVDLAFLSYSLTDTVTLNMGRFRLPFYHYSSFIDVGYAYHWVRAPMDYYSIPHTSTDGANVRYADYLFDTDVEIELQAWYGNSDVVSVIENADGEEESSTISTRKDIGLTATFTWEWFKFRVLHNTKDIALSPEFVLDTTYDSAGIIIDWENIVFRSEYAELDNGGASATPSWYVSAGYQIGQFKPHITVSQSDPAMVADFNSFVEVPGLDFPVPGPDTVNIDQVIDSITVGIRWDVHSNTALKVEYISRETETETTGFLDNAYIGTSTDEVNMVALSVDVVF